MTYYTSRSAIECYQHCPRKRYLNYHYGPKELGIVPVRRNVNLQTGIAVHKAVERFLSDSTAKLDEVVEDIRKWYVDEARKALIDGPGTFTKEQQIWTIVEQRALIEAMIRVWYLAEFPRLRENYETVCSEKEMQVDLGNNIVMQSRVDAVFKKKNKQNEIYNYSLKTGKTWKPKYAQSFDVNLQTLTEMTAVKSDLKLQITGTSFCHIIKGIREEDKDRGVYITKNPFIYGYRKVDVTGTSYAHSLFYPNPLNASGRGRLGKGWEPFHVWSKKDGYEGGVKQWVTDIWQGKIQSEYGWDLLMADWCVRPVESFRSKVEMEEALDEIRLQEQRVFHALYKDSTHTTKELFPMYRNGCYWPLPCEYLAICHGLEAYSGEVADPTIKDDPIGSGRYEVRVPHHELVEEL